MLKQLYIKDYALIDELNIDLHRGFSVITGETGAGKSIILGALGLLLGQRADIKSIKSGAKKCTVEAHFDLSRYPMEDFFTENEIDYDLNDCILRREITATGKSRAFINDTPVTLTTMRLLGQQLVDIHSQHQNLLLQEEDFQLRTVDIIADNSEILHDYQSYFKQYQSICQQIEQQKQTISEIQERADYIRFQYQELSKVDLYPEMQTELEQERDKLSHVEEIKLNLFSAEQQFSSDEGGGILSQLKEVSRHINDITDVYPSIKETAERIDNCMIELKDLYEGIRNEVQDIDYDPQRLEQINNTLDTLYSLEQKHHVSTVEELITLRDELKEQLNTVDNSDELLQKLQEEEQQMLATCNRLAQQLTKERKKAAKKIEKEMTERLVPLGIPQVRFAIEITDKPLSSTGADKISFLFSANTNTPMLPVADVASGGEIARVMLSLKAMISNKVKLPTIIFDEIDTGVSGKIAEKMGHVMQEMGANDRQVISITHLPQIAARGSHHYKVRKEESIFGTTTTMVMLNKEERLQEIAQMLSGADITAAAIDNAKA
ncbi:MAG: DNA repair protein RecN, partial [Prevotella sp.]|nr:DNA repair protein RecN [Prevotella sp.]